ncbi:MAG: hypothetical protein ACHQHP_01150 [Bacteroidia bacterium]
MKTNFFLKFFLFTYAFVLCSCSHETFSGAWQKTPVKVDAKINDWEIPLRLYDDATKLNYAVTNDADNLYLCMRASDVHVQMKIMQAGMQVWIDTTGKKKQKIGIFFPLSTGEKIRYDIPGATGSQNFETDDKREQLKMRGDFLASNKQMQLKGFKPPLAGTVPLHSEGGIELSINWDSTNTLIYEAKIPLATFYKKSLSASDSEKVFSIGIYVNGIEVKSSGPGGGSGAGAMAPATNGMGSIGGSGMASGMAGGRGKALGSGLGEEYKALAKTRNVWVRFKLAAPR